MAILALPTILATAFSAPLMRPGAAFSAPLVHPALRPAALSPLHRPTMAAAPEVQAAFVAIMLLSVTHGMLPQPPFKSESAARKSAPQRKRAGRSRPLSMRADDDDDDAYTNLLGVRTEVAKDGEKIPWERPGLFAPANLGPWAILAIVGIFQALNGIRDQLPPAVQDAIPVILGEQYRAP